MAFVLKIRRMDIQTGDDARIVVLRGHDATSFGITPGDRLQVRYRRRLLTVVADVTHQSIQHGEIGLFGEVTKALNARDGEPLTIEVISRPASINAIKKKLLGKSLTRPEVFSVITDIVHHRLTSIETTYFVASGYVKPYSVQEITWMVEAMAKTGEMFHWPTRRVVDKHSVGGLAGNRTTLVTVPIVASLGLIIPKTSSRAITSPAGTADTMEVLAPVTFSGREIRRIVRQTGACLIWGGGVSIAPADDIIVRLSRPLSLEPYDKMIVSIMAKKVAMGVKYLIIDLPYGPGTKVSNLATAQVVAKKFEAVARAFHMRVHVRIDRAEQPIGQGIGPALEARDVLRVLQQKNERPLDLERKALSLATELLVLAGFANPQQAAKAASTALRSGQAWKKMQQIITAQGGNPKVDANDLTKQAFTARIVSTRAGRVRAIDNRVVDEIARTLGAPEHKLAGIYLHRKIGDRLRRGDKLFTLYSYNHDRLDLAKAALARLHIYSLGSGSSR